MSFIGDLIKANILVNGRDYSFVGGGQLRNSGVVIEKGVATTIVTVGPETYTVAQILGGLILRDPSGAARTDTFPTAVSLVSGIKGAQDGDSFLVAVRNTADLAETITIAAGAGGTVSGTATIAQNNTKLFKVIIDDASVGSEAYTIYSIGTMAH